MQNGVSDPVGSAYALYTPDVPGTYTIKFSFPDQVAQLAGYTGLNGSNSQYVGDLYTGSKHNNNNDRTTNISGLLPGSPDTS